jgi:hypothetical protein
MTKKYIFVKGLKILILEDPKENSTTLSAQDQLSTLVEVYFETSIKLMMSSREKSLDNQLKFQHRDSPPQGIGLGYSPGYSPSHR